MGSCIQPVRNPSKVVEPLHLNHGSPLVAASRAEKDHLVEAGNGKLTEASFKPSHKATDVQQNEADLRHERANLSRSNEISGLSCASNSESSDSNSQFVQNVPQGAITATRSLIFNASVRTRESRGVQNSGKIRASAKLAGPNHYLLIREGICSKVPHLGDVGESSIMKRRNH